MGDPILIVIFTILNYLDYRTTYIIITSGGCELNPVMNSLILNYGFKGFLIFKIIINIFIGLFATNLGLMILIIMYILIVINNLYHLINTKTKLSYKDLYYPFY
jgi:hypothetical protein